MAAYPVTAEGELQHAPPYATWTGISPVQRFYEPKSGPCVYVAVMTGRLVPDVSGERMFRVHWPGTSPDRVWVDGKLVDDRWKSTSGQAGDSWWKLVLLKAGQAVDLPHGVSQPLPGQLLPSPVPTDEDA